MTANLDQVSLIIIGAVIGVLPAAALEWLRWRRQDRQSWREDRRRTYADFLVHLSNIERDTVALARHVARSPQAQLSAEDLRHPGTLPEGVLRDLVKERSETAEQLIASYETLKLVTSTDCRRTDKQIIDAYNQLLLLARNGAFEPDPGWIDVRSGLAAARTRFQDAARGEILGSEARR